MKKFRSSVFFAVFALALQANAYRPDPTFACSAATYLDGLKDGSTIQVVFDLKTAFSKSSVKSNCTLKNFKGGSYHYDCGGFTMKATPVNDRSIPGPIRSYFVEYIPKQDSMFTRKCERILDMPPSQMQLTLERQIRLPQTPGPAMRQFNESAPAAGRN